LCEWYTSRGGVGGSSGSHSAAVLLGVLGGGLPHLQQRLRETFTPQQLREWYVQRAASRSSARCPYVIRTGDRAGQTCGTGVEIFAVDYDAILTAMYALSASAEGDCSRCVPPNPGIAAVALGASESGTLPGTTPAEALHTIMLDSDASRCFFRDSTTLTPLPAPVTIRLANPSGGLVVASSFTRRPGSNQYTLATEPPQVAAFAQMSASSQVATSCSCRLLSHQTLLWHHRLGHPSLPRLRGMHSRLLVSGLPRSLPPLPPSPAPPCLPCVEGWQRATPHSSSFPATSAPLQTLHMDVWGPARVSGRGSEHYFLLVVDDYTWYTTVFPLCSKGEVVDVLIPWIRTVRLKLRERFGTDLPVLCLHSNRGGEFSSDLLRDFCRGEGILQLFMLPDSPQQNGISEHHMGLVMEVAHTSMIHAAAPHFLWIFAVRYAAHQLNLWPCASFSETSPTLRWIGKVGDASVFRVWGSRAFVRDTSADKLCARAIPCAFLGFVPDAPGWQFYHPTARRVLPSQDVTFDESVPFYRLFPYRSAPPPPPPLFLAPGPPPVDPLAPQGLAPSGVSQVEPLPCIAPAQVAVGSDAAPGAASGACAASPTVARLLPIAVTDPSFGSAVASARVAKLLEFATASRLEYTSALVAESVPAISPSVGGECALGADVLEDRQEDFECLAAAVPCFASMLLAPEGDPDAPDIPTPRSYAEAITDLLPHPKDDYELHSLDFSTAFLQGSLHEEIWLRRPPGFTGTFPAGTQWSLRRPVYGLRQAPREWHDTLRTTLAALGFAPSTADSSVFLRTDTSLPPFYVLVYVEDLVFATAHTEALTLVKSQLQKRHTCTGLGELRSYLGLQITRDRARRTITLTQSHMVHQVLQRLGFHFSLPQPTPLSTSHSLSAPPSVESVEPSGPYPELVGCLITSGMGLVLGGRGPVVLTGHADASQVDDSATQRSSQGYTFSLGCGSVSWRSTRSSSVLSSCCEAEIYAGAMAAQELRWLTYLLTN
ncbi:unnamed protein product, partial [Closterium sp. NIES-54]